MVSLLLNQIRSHRIGRSRVISTMGRMFAAYALSLSLRFAGIAITPSTAAVPHTVPPDMSDVDLPPAGRMLRGGRGRGRGRGRGWRGGRRGGRSAAAVSGLSGNTSIFSGPPDVALFPASTADGGILHVIPEGGSLTLECDEGTWVERISFASFGKPKAHANGSYAVDESCHLAKSADIIRRACEGQSHCCLPVGTDHFERRDPCPGSIKTLAVVVHGCRPLADAQTRYRRWCSLQGQWLLCDEDIEFLASLELPEPSPQALLPHVAAMVDTSWRPELQHYVVHNVHNTTGWPIQLFHGPTNGPKVREHVLNPHRLRALICRQVEALHCLRVAGWSLVLAASRPLLRPRRPRRAHADKSRGRLYGGLAETLVDDASRCLLESNDRA